MEITDINQKIKVGAVFEGSLIKPKWFIWVNKKFEVKKVAMRWKSIQGAAVILHFSVTDEKTLYQLSLNQKTMEWTLEKIGVE